MKQSLPLLALLAGMTSCRTPSTVIQSTPTGVIASGPTRSALTETRFASHQSYRGWPGSWLLSNGHVWTAVVPSLGRVMQFGFVNDAGVFWENPKTLSQPMTTNPWAITGSFGGDKTWPAPQSAWNWPPPDVFDREAVTARPVAGGLVLESGVSPSFGIRTVRRVELLTGEPVMRITTTYHKLQGEPVEVGVWVITQMKNPTAMYLPIPLQSQFPNGHSEQWGIPAKFLSRKGQQLSLIRDPQTSHKIGNDADSVTWQNARFTLTIESPRIAGATYPDQGCSMEIYTNGGDTEYIELETLGPLRRLSVGDTLSATNIYRLGRR